MALRGPGTPGLLRLCYRVARYPQVGWSLALAVVLLVPVISSNASQLSRYESVLIALLVVLGLNLMFGYAGELSIGQPVIMGVAAYAVGVLSARYQWTAFATLPIALVAGVVVAVVLNSVSLRLKGWYLAVTTFFAVTVLPDLLGVFDTWTQGSNGLGGIMPIPGMNLSIAGNSVREYELIALITAATWLVFRNLQASRWGIVLRALRDCRNGLVASGGNLLPIRFAVTVVAAVPVAIAGWLTAHVNMFLVPDSFGLNQLLLFVGAVLLGGRGTVWGPVIGTLLFEGISLWIGPFSTVNQIVLGASVLVISAAFPIGLVGAWRRLIPILAARLPATMRLAPAISPTGAVNPNRTAREKLAALVGPVAEQAKTSDSSVILDVAGVGKSFGGVRALNAVDLELRVGRITGLVGPNGSGKTTLLNIITGFVKPDEGKISLAGRAVTGLPAHAMARRGVRRSFQTPQLVGELTVEQNVILGLIGGSRQRIFGAILRGPGYRRRTSALNDRVDGICTAFGLADRAQVTVDELPLGVRRIVEIARAVVAGPRVICLDEPAAGLGEADLEHLQTVLRHLAELGFAVLLIEHNLAFVRGVSDTVVSLDLGRVVDVTARGAGQLAAATEPASLVLRSLDAPTAVGGEVTSVGELDSSTAGSASEAPLLSVNALSAWYGQAQALFDVSLHVSKGEIVGILGANGAGKSTLLRSIARVHRRVKGSVYLGERELLRLHAPEVASRGVSLVREGALVFPNLTVAEHIAFAHQLIRRRGGTWSGEERVWEWLPILAERQKVRAGLLSGGQRQLLALAVAAMSDPVCLLLDEPSAGLAESVRETVFEAIRTIARQGGTLLIAEQSDRWLRGLAGRVYELEVGRLVSEFGLEPVAVGDGQ